MAVTGWRAIQDAIQLAVATAAGLPSSSVVWSWQNGDQPADPYVRLAMPDVATHGQDFLYAQYDGTRPAGQEFELQPMGTREVAIELQMFTVAVADETSAQFALDALATALIRPSVRDGLTRVGVSIFDVGDARFAPAVVGANFRGRALCTLRSYIPAQAASDFVGYIQTVSAALFASGGKQPPPVNGTPVVVVLP